MAAGQGLADRLGDDHPDYAVALTNHASLLRARGMIEKPAPDAAPSTLAAIGRYVLEATVFDHLERRVSGAGGEIQLTDAIAATMDRAPLHACRFDGERFDCGDKLGFLKANVASALQRPDLAEGFADYLKTVIAKLNKI